MSARPRDWSRSEDRRLLDGRALRMGWSAIAALLPGRTAHAAAARHRYLTEGRQQRTAPPAPPPSPPKPHSEAAWTPPPFTHPDAARQGSERLHAATIRMFERRAG